MEDPGDLAWSVDVSVPNVARIYDYMLGGKPNSLVGGVGRKPAQVP